MPGRLAVGWRYVHWTHTQDLLRIYFNDNAQREITFIAAPFPFKGKCSNLSEKTFQLAGVKVWWSHTAYEQQAWRCVNGIKLIAVTSLAPNHFADVGLGRIVASARHVG